MMEITCKCGKATVEGEPLQVREAQERLAGNCECGCCHTDISEYQERPNGDG